MVASEITATDGETLLVDPDAMPILLRHRWYPVPIDGSPSVYATHIGSAVVYLAHLVFGARKNDGVISFFDKNPKNCQYANLVAMDMSASRHRASQRKRSRKTTSEYRGVIRDPRNNRFRAKFRRDYLGTFDNEEDAARAYDKAARAQFGPLAVLNFADVAEADDETLPLGGETD